MMGRISVIVGPELARRIYDEGAALPYRGLSVLDDKPWGEGDLRFLDIITDQLPPGAYGRGHYDAVIEGCQIKFKRDCDV